MKRLLLVSASIFVLRTFASFDIGAHFASEEAWKAFAVDFVREHQADGFRFTSQERESATSLAKDKVTFKGIPVMESRVFFSGAEGITRVELSLFNKGDARVSLDEAAFKTLLDEARTALGDPPGSKGPRTAEAEPKPGFKQCKQLRLKTFPASELAWAYQKYSAKRPFASEFVRITLVNASGDTAATKKLFGIGTGMDSAKSGSAVKKNVQTNSKGDVYLDGVPMVDQGQKGYCAVATSERVLRYFGVSVDEHEIAQLAGSSASGGTSFSEMSDTVQKIGQKYKLDKKDVVKLAGKDFMKSDFMKTLKLYNQQAKAAKKPEIKMDDFKKQVGPNSYMIDLQGMIDAMDAKLLKEGRAKLAMPYKSFREAVHKQVNDGVPLFWGVMLGWYPEPEIPQAKGGHMRLIIGYNDKTKEILYTDSWGAGHELKRMPEDWAWTITQNLIYLKPRH